MQKSTVLAYKVQYRRVGGLNLYTFRSQDGRGVSRAKSGNQEGADTDSSQEHGTTTTRWQTERKKRRSATSTTATTEIESWQHATAHTPLIGWEKIERLLLNMNPITDITVLGSLPELISVNLVYCPVEDLSPAAHLIVEYAEPLQ